jgi:hypothetical protein
MKTVNIKGREYIEVNERLKYFRENYKNWSLTSDLISLENGVCVIKATIRDENEIIKATGLAYEKENSTFINKTSYIENCETSAWGRALGNLGIGIDTSVASAEEVQNAINNQNPKDSTINNDLDIFAGLEACSDLDNLKLYYQENCKKVKDKKGFAELKDKLKEAMYV